MNRPARAPRPAAFAAVALACVAGVSAQSPITLNPENVLVIDTTRGRLVVEMRPDIAPRAVERVKTLTRDRVYDGLLFHRVVPRFVAQTGNPNNRDGGSSSLPNLPPEFLFRFDVNTADAIATRSSDGHTGLLGSVPFAGAVPGDSARAADGLARAWGAYCPGVAGMGRQAARDSANSEIFFMLEADRRLDRDYTVWGRIVDGMPVLKALAAGVPPAAPDAMTRVRVLSDVAASEKFQVMLPPKAETLAAIAAARRRLGADFSICDIEIKARISP